MGIIGNDIVCIGANGTVHKFVIVMVGGYQSPFVIYGDWFCMRRIDNGLDDILIGFLK